MAELNTMLVGEASKNNQQDKQILADNVAAKLAFERQKDLMDKQMRNQEKLNNMQFRQSLDALKLSPALTRQGLENAGINPQVMAGGSFNQVANTSSGSASGGSVSPVSNPLSSMAYEQRSLMAATAEKTRAEAESIQLENRNKMSEQTSLDTLIRDELQKCVDNPNLPEKTRQSCELLLQNTDRAFDKGTLSALTGFLSWKQDGQKYDMGSLDLALKKLKTALESKVLEIQNAPDSDTPAYLADVPRQKWFQTTYDLARLYTLSALQASQAALTVDESQKIDAEIAMLYTELSKTYHGDFAQMWKNGHYQEFFTSIFAGGLQQAIGLGADILIFKGLGRLSKLGGLLRRGKDALKSDSAKETLKTMEEGLKKGSKYNASEVFNKPRSKPSGAPEIEKPNYRKIRYFTDMSYNKDSGVWE